eukprot:m.52016 g.52016  ORF g.52016 m.52016 type:complete len:90 (-) comp10980_c0_seq2:673-942(-)
MTVELGRCPLHEDGDTLLQKRVRAREDHDADEEGADGVCEHKTVLFYQQRRDDYTNTSQCVRNDVQQNTLHDKTTPLLLIIAMSMCVSV